MAKAVYESSMMVLYERMKSMQKDFESKKQESNNSGYILWESNN